MSPNTRAYLTLTLTPGLGPMLIRRLVEQLGSAEAVLGARAVQLGEVQGIAAKNAGKLKRSIDTTAGGDLLKREADTIARHGADLICIEDPGYPALLREVHDAPPLLWVRGKLVGDDALSLAVVGSRKCSHYGREQADQLSNALAGSGVTIVSGGAYGIDVAAHRGALRAAGGGVGRTLAVLGSGLGKPYPEDHADLFGQIVESDGEKGAVVSEFPMLTEPRPENFLRRNRVISGLSVGVLVIEAGKRSGALSTARRCVDEHGRELMVLPGRVDSPYSVGCHEVLKEGWGRLVTGVSDILDVIGEQKPLLTVAAQTQRGGGTEDLGTVAMDGQGEQASSEAGTPLLSLLDEPRSLDELVAWTGQPASQIQVELTMLEIRGSITRQGGLFVRRRSNL
ncbi:MAG: DNA-processing protein DprA [Planctomycetota bacterium]